MAADGKTTNISILTEEVTSSIHDSSSSDTERLRQHTGSEENGYSEEKNPFRDPAVAQHWTEVYEKSQYECRHVFDPSLSWTEEEERRLIRKLDWRVCLWAVGFVLSSNDDTRRFAN